MIEQGRRIGLRDCLYMMLVDLAAQARMVRPWDADARTQWFDAAVWLLGQVPDAAQRAAWTQTLALAITQPGLPPALVVGELWRRVEERPCA
jgi:hypothetical protein